MAELIEPPDVLGRVTVVGRDRRPRAGAQPRRGPCDVGRERHHTEAFLGFYGGGQVRRAARKDADIDDPIFVRLRICHLTGHVPVKSGPVMT